MYVCISFKTVVLGASNDASQTKNYQRKRIVADDYDTVLEILSFWNKKFRKRFHVSARVCSKVAISRDSPTPPLFNHRL